MTTKVTSITSRDNALLLRIRKLTAQPDGYRRQGLVWIEGEHLCRACVERAHGDSPSTGGSGAIRQAVIGESAWSAVPALHQLASQADAVAVVTDSLLADASPLQTPASLAFLIDWAGPGTVIAEAPTIVLDRLQDAGNVGTILRTAAAFGFTQVVALKGTAALWSPKVMRAGMGAHFALNLVEGADAGVLDVLSAPLYATSSHAKAVLDQAPLPWPCSWALGHEGEGLDEALMQRCADVLRIAQPGGQESLNVAIAAAICMHESARRRLTTEVVRPLG